MTIDEAIKIAKDQAEENRKEAYYTSIPWHAKDCERWAEEHEQLADWLEELKDYRRFNGAKTFDNGFNQGEKYGYNKAIDDFTEKVMKKFTELDLKDRCPTVTDCKIILSDMAEELKECAE